MVSEDATTKVLAYLKKQGQSNTFRLATELGIDRSRILNIVKKLEEKHAVDVRSGIVKFPVKEKRVVKKGPIEVKKVSPKVIRKTIIKKVYVKPKRLKEQAEYIEKLEEDIKELQKKVAEPKIIRRTITKKVPIVKKVYVQSKKLKEQAEHIKELEEKIKELQSAPPKIIRRTIVKKVPVNIKDEKPKKKKIFKLPKLTWFRNIQQLKKPSVVKQKISITKPNFTKLAKNIQELNVPDVFKKGG